MNKVSFFDIYKSLDFSMDFQDPATLYMDSLIRVHNNVMWYIFFIIVIVFWALYVIVRESFWSIGAKLGGFLRFFFFNYTFVRRVHAFIFFLVSSIFNPIIVLFVTLVNYFIMNLIIRSFPQKFNLFNNLTFFFIVNNRVFDVGVGHIWLRFAIFFKSSFDKTQDFFKRLYLSFLIAGPTNSGYYKFGRVGAINSSITHKYSTFVAIQKFTHSISVEMVWATFPTLIILSMLAPSVFLIYSIDLELDPVFSFKVIGHQWFWSYEIDGWVPTPKVGTPVNVDSVKFVTGDLYSFSTFEFDSVATITDSLNPGDRRLLEVDNPLLVPCSIGIRFLITSADVLHAWAIPEFGIKVDAVPGRLSQAVSLIRRPGVYYGQCSEICGIAHGFMPIVVNAYVQADWGTENISVYL